MSIEVKVPALPESVADATVAQWHKKPGDAVKRDETLLELETDKVMLEVPALQDGVLESILKPVGSQVTAQEVLGTLSASSNAVAKPAPSQIPAAKEEKTQSADSTSPAVRRLLNEHDLKADQIQGTGKAGRITKEDVLSQTKQVPPAENKQVSLPISTGERPEQRVPMSRLRARIAERLVSVQHETAMLTTFNEVNMQPVMDLRARYKDTFEKTHQARLGFMSFFVKAAVEALKRFPAVNASIDGSDVIYHGYYDIGIAISSPRGLVVPILRDVDTMSMAQVEKEIASYSEKARQAKLTMEDMTGGTFTITNGGTFGSMLSTPILNPPQSAILGMHNIVKRAVVENDQIVIRPIMYLALSYDHRLIDGSESVRFLYTIKELLEDPSRLLLGV